MSNNNGNSRNGKYTSPKKFSFGTFAAGAVTGAVVGYAALTTLHGSKPLSESKATPEQKLLIQEINKGAKGSGVECYDKSGEAGGYLNSDETRAKQKELVQEVLRGDIKVCTAYPSPSPQ